MADILALPLTGSDFLASFTPQVIDADSGLYMAQNYVDQRAFIDFFADDDQKFLSFALSNNLLTADEFSEFQNMESSELKKRLSQARSALLTTIPEGQRTLGEPIFSYRPAVSNFPDNGLPFRFSVLNLSKDVYSSYGVLELKRFPDAADISSFPTVDPVPPVELEDFGRYILCASYEWNFPNVGFSQYALLQLTVPTVKTRYNESIIKESAKAFNITSDELLDGLEKRFSEHNYEDYWMKVIKEGSWLSPFSCDENEIREVSSNIKFGTFDSESQ